MVPGRRRWRQVRLVGNSVAAACAAAAVLFACAAGFGDLPPLARVLDPGHGAWASAAGGQLPRSGTLALPGLGGGAEVSFDSRGIATIGARSLADSMVVLGYLHARFRLVQMDLQRRLAEGRLAQLDGQAGIGSDTFELRLGLLRTARREWAALPKSGRAAALLTAYARGVNDYLAQVRASGQWPAVYSVAGVYPARWTPVDSLAVQGLLTQQLDYSATPLDYALLARRLGIRRVMQWLPVVGRAAGQPYDPGPYRALGVAPLAGASTTSAQVATRPAAPAAVSAPVARAAATLLAAGAGMPSAPPPGGAGPAGYGAWPGASAWAVNGPRVAGGGAMLAGQAPAPGPVPSSWYQVAVAAPGYDVSGVSLPGLPGILVGHNRRIAWSVSPAQDQSALFYAEKTSPAEPGRYYWRGRWRPMRTVRYTIPVRGAAPRQLAVRLTAHGPVLTTSGQPLSVDWTGSAASPDIAVLAKLGSATSFAGFAAALAGWHAPALTFVYADDRGNIGAVTAGYFPVLRRGAPWLPLRGTGADDVAGVIPYRALPRAYDPPGHVIAAAGQRAVTAGYPYYLGTSATARDGAGGAARAYASLGRRHGLIPPDLAALQTSQVDEQAARLAPRLLAALHRAALSPAEQRAASLLRRWNHAMDPRSAAAAIWATFWPGYVSAVFGPWLRPAVIPPGGGQAALAAWAARAGLSGALARWTLADPANPAFTGPGGRAGTAVTAMRAAFRAAIAGLQARQGGAPAGWALDQVPGWQAAGASPESAASLPVLGRGGTGAAALAPWLAGLAAGAQAAPAAGQGWRMIVRLRPSPLAAASAGVIEAEGIYAGGQDETPGSPWFGNLTARWVGGGYLLMPSAGPPAPGRIRWVLLPGVERRRL